MTTCARFGHRKISIHAPREGGDAELKAERLATIEFQSTPPARGATAMQKAIDAYFKISIHAPREGGDDSVYAQYIWAIGISIHAPREGGDFTRCPGKMDISVFQSTPPARGATRPLQT